MMSGQSETIKPNKASCRGLSARRSDTTDCFTEDPAISQLKDYYAVQSIKWDGRTEEMRLAELTEAVPV
jgi:hypothetical protein